MNYCQKIRVRLIGVSEMSQTLESLSKSEDKNLSKLALKLIELGEPKHTHYEILLRKVIK